MKASKIPAGEAKALMNDARAASGGGLSFYLGGDVVDMAETPEGGPSEGIGVTAAAIVLLISDHTSQAMTGPARAHMRPGFIALRRKQSKPPDVRRLSVMGAPQRTCADYLLWVLPREPRPKTEARHNGGSARGYLADLSRCQHSGRHGRARRDSDRAPDIYASHRVRERAHMPLIGMLGVAVIGYAGRSCQTLRCFRPRRLSVPGLGARGPAAGA